MTLIHEFESALAANGFKGEIESSLEAQLAYATDNSIYYQQPRCILFPKDSTDISTTLATANKKRWRYLNFTAKGGGSSTNGQSLGDSVIIDMSRHLNQIIEFNPTENWIKVQPGVTLDQINQYLSPYQKQLGPSVAPSNRATIGGMINTDASGKGSLTYGKTSEHILNLKIIDWVGSEKTLKQLQKDDSFSENIHSIVDKHIDEIYTTFPHIPRFHSGYNLTHIIDPEQKKLQLQYLFAGSEGTLGIISEAQLKVVDRPSFTELVIFQHPNIESAATHTQEILTHAPHAIECMDGKTLLYLPQEYPNIIKDRFQKISPNDIFLVAECKGESSGECSEKSQKLKHSYSHHININTSNEILEVWNARSKGVENSAKLGQYRHPIAFMEDTVVPVENLPEYSKELEDILRHYNLNYVLYGHIDAGCLHIRPGLDLSQRLDRSKMNSITKDVVELCKHYDGIFWGEHGKGYRAHLNKDVFSDAINKCFKQIKHLCDPLNKLNPNKLTNTKTDVKLRSEVNKQTPNTLKTRFSTVLSCNGNAKCHSKTYDQLMCPTSKPQSNKIHSPKGRAECFKAWLNQTQHVDDTAHLEATFRVLDTCIECKACSQQCPVKVNIPDAKSHFLNHYYSRNIRPFRDYLIGHIETIATYSSKLPIISNIGLHNPLSKWIIRYIVGLRKLPTFSRKRMSSKKGEFDIWKPNFVPKPNSIYILSDPLTWAFDQGVLNHGIDLLIKLGFRPVLLPQIATGKPLHSKGFSNSFQNTAKKTHGFLSQLNPEVPIITFEPSTGLVFRDEYSRLFPKQRYHVHLFHEWLKEIDICESLEIAESPSPVFLYSHCHERSLIANNDTLWESTLKKFNITMIPVSRGCCGMAGSFGLESKNKHISKQLSSAHLAHITQHQSPVLSTGFSCRKQLKHQKKVKALHPVSYLNLMVKEYTNSENID